MVETFARFEGLDVPVWDVLEEAPPPPVVPRPPIDLLPQAVQLTVPRVQLAPAQLAVLTDAVSRVRCRPGEDGLPPAVLFFDFRSRTEMMPAASAEAAKRRVQTCVRDGDVAVRFDDGCVALLCGGLFFPGDIEVIGSRVRRLVQETRQVLFNVDDLEIAVSGALASPAEDVRDFLVRGASARAHVLANGLTDVVVDYVSST